MSVLSTHRINSSLVPSPVPYSVLHPDGPTDGLPLLLWLHGGGGSNEFLETCRPVFDRCWSTGTLPPLVAVTPAAQRSFYLDRDDSGEQWETFITNELIDHLEAEYRIDWARIALSGISMGGSGSLRMAFRHPDRFVAVAALEPAIEESTEWDGVLRRDRVYGDDGAIGEPFGDPVDSEFFADNHPRSIAEHNRAAIAASALAIYIECGDEDLLHLQYGSEALHRQLFAHGIRHEYRLVRGGNHLGPSLPGRFGDALGFVGRHLRSLDETEPEHDEMLTSLAARTDTSEDASGYRRRQLVAGQDGPIEVHLQGEGPPVVMVPSLGRGAEDFARLAADLAEHGYTAACPQPRGFGGSASPLDNLSMEDQAADIAAVIRHLGDEPATIAGHAYGNRVARTTAAFHPELVESVVLFACGGLVPPTPDAASALHRVFDVERSDEEHLEAVGTAFFAPGNDPSVWFDGWNGLVAAVQGAATDSTPVEVWWEAGGADVLVIQPADDVIAVPENARRIADSLGERATVITIPDAGHALLPEQPEAVAAALFGWLDGRVTSRSLDG